MGTSKGTIHVPRETVLQDTHLWPVCEIRDNFSVASVDCLITPTLDSSVLNQITVTETKKYV